MSSLPEALASGDLRILAWVQGSTSMHCAKHSWVCWTCTVQVMLYHAMYQAYRSLSLEDLHHYIFQVRSKAVRPTIWMTGMLMEGMDLDLPHQMDISLMWACLYAWILGACMPGQSLARSWKVSAYMRLSQSTVPP